MHDLWIFPTPRASRWFARMDWYLNWQMCKGLAYAGLHLPAETFRVAEEHGLPVALPPSAPAPLLVLPNARVPVKKCLVMDDREESPAAWLARVAAAVPSLNARTARVFLPRGFAVADAEARWRKLGPKLDASFEADLGVNQ